MNQQSVTSKTEEQKDNDTYAKNFTRVPNILFESYRYITKEEVLLYIRLRYVYWDTKPRYFSLRELADITGYSTGALSKMLPRLTIVGLIHAEIRKKKGKDGKEKGNPIYHVTINDIWEENRKFFTEGYFDPSEVLLVHEVNATRSPNEQDNAQPVHQMNKPVHKMNDLVHQMRQASSPNEQDQAQKEAHKITYKTSNKTSLQDKDTLCVAAIADDTAPDASLSENDIPTEARMPAIKIPTSPLPAQDTPPTRFEVAPEQAGSGDSDTSSQISTTFPQGGINGELKSKGETSHEHRKDSPAPDSGVPAATSERGDSVRAGHVDAQKVKPRYALDDHVVVKGLLTAVIVEVKEDGTYTVEATHKHARGYTKNGSRYAATDEDLTPQTEVTQAKGKSKEKPAPQGPPQMPPEDAPWNTRTCLAIFDARRGAYLIPKYKLMEAANCAKGLAEQYSRTQVMETIEDMEADPWWASKFIDVCNVANNIAKYRNRRRLTIKAIDTPVMSVEDEFNQYYSGMPGEKRGVSYASI